MKIKEKKILAWAIYDNEYGFIHYQINEEVRFFRTKKSAEKELEYSNKGGKVVRILITLNPKQ